MDRAQRLQHDICRILSLVPTHAKRGNLQQAVLYHYSPRAACLGSTGRHEGIAMVFRNVRRTCNDRSKAARRSVTPPVRTH